MIIKMVDEFKFTLVHFARCIYARGFTAEQKNVENQD